MFLLRLETDGAKRYDPWDRLERLAGTKRGWTMGQDGEHGGGDLDEEPFGGGRGEVQRVLSIRRQGLRQAAGKGETDAHAVVLMR